MSFFRLPFYPFILALLFPLQLYASNVFFFQISSVFRAIVFLLVVTGVLFFVLWVPTRHSRLAAYIVACLLVMFFTLIPTPLLMSGFCAALALIGIAVRRLGLASEATLIANVVVLSVLVTPVAKIARVAIATPQSEALDFGPFTSLGDDLRRGTVTLPSVAHIVLDGYGGDAALRDIYGFNNSSFKASLRSLGFTVVEDMAVPFNQTLLSMSSVMNAGIPPLRESPLSDLSDDVLRLTMARTIVEGAVVRAFKAKGHGIAFTQTGYNAFRYPEYASEISKPPSLFELSLFDVYLLILTLERWGLSLLGTSELAAPLDLRVKYALSLDAVEPLRAPFFLYSHVLSPHPPFTMDRNGDPTDRWGFGLMEDGDHSVGDNPTGDMLYREGYLEKLRYTNKSVLEQARHLIESVDGPLVIIIHGDHGPGLHLANESAEDTCLKERMQTTFALYTNVPAIREAVEEAEIGNIINIYRVIFGALLGREFPLLDTQYFAKWSAPTDLTPVGPAEYDRNCD